MKYLDFMAIWLRQGDDREDIDRAFARSEREAWLFGKKADAKNFEARKRVGFMTQNFSLYGEFKVRQSLALHARFFHLISDEISFLSMSFLASLTFYLMRICCLDCASAYGWPVRSSIVRWHNSRCF
ncbi:hypothetical protein [Roseovarius sp. Pro17]|uniref:hypothetical protein n=1 Tax=Roseovarius sp. Pro17 TaxID=3108175 RepID=UPI002D774CDD|nr:hypothetical protein [Roseovarius sp. Pro17]